MVGRNKATKLCISSLSWYQDLDMHTVDRALQKIKKNSEVYSIPIDFTEDFKLAQFATILHDISHLHFSHALDNNSY